MTKSLSVVISSCLIAFFASCGMSPGEDVISLDPQGGAVGSDISDQSQGANPDEVAPQEDSKPKPIVPGVFSDKLKGAPSQEEWEAAMEKNLPDYLKNSEYFQQASFPLRLKVYQNVLKNKNNADNMLLTHFGYVKPVRAGSPELSGKLPFAGNGFAVGGFTSKPAPYFIEGNCTEDQVTSEYICIRRPAKGENGRALPGEEGQEIYVDGDGNYYLPVGSAGLTIVAYVYYDDFEILDPNDYRILVSVVNQLDEDTNGGIGLPDKEIKFYDSANVPGGLDFHADDENGNPLPDNIRRIEFSIGLDGPGLNTISITGNFLSSNPSEKTVYFPVYKTEPVEIALSDMYINNVEGVGKESFNPGDTVPILYSNDGSKTIQNQMNFDVQVAEGYAFSPGTQLIFENRDDDGILQGQMIVGGVADASIDMGIYRGMLSLKPGFNNITIKGRERSVYQDGEKVTVNGVKNPIQLTIFYDRVPYRVSTESPTLFATNEGNKVQYQFCFRPLEGGNCNNAPGLDNLEVRVNGKKVATLDNIGNNNGVYNVQAPAQFGVNIVEIYSGGDATLLDLVHSDAFIYGDPVHLVKNGDVKSGKSTFTPRGLSLDLGNNFLKNDLKELIQRYVDRGEIRNDIIDMFKSTKTTQYYSCPDYLDPDTGKPVTSDGQYSFEFLDEYFKLGPKDGNGKAIEILNVEGVSGGVLWVNAKINGFYGEADLRPIKGTGQTFGGTDVAFTALTLAVEEIEVNLGIRFSQDLRIDANQNGKNDTSGIDVVAVPGKNIVVLTPDKDVPSKRAAWINPARQPSKEYEALTADQLNFVEMQLMATIGGTFLCGLEEGFNHPDGALGSSVVDVLEQVDYDPGNIFRYSFGFDLFGSKKKLDLAINPLEGQFIGDDSGLHLMNVPVRVNSGQESVKDAYSLSYVSRPGSEDTLEPIDHAEGQDLSARISEDVLNNAILAFLSAKGLNINLDPRFYTSNGSAPTTYLFPNGNDLAGDIDLNFDGRVDETDKNYPVLWQVRPDINGSSVRTPIMFSWLSQSEVQELQTQEAAGGNGTPFFSIEKGNYFKVSVPNLTISAFRMEPASGENAKLAKIPFCKQVYPKALELKLNPNLESGGFCSNTTTIMTPLSSGDISDEVGQAFSCTINSVEGIEADSAEEVIIPRWNGTKQSFDSNTDVDDIAPIYTLKLNLQLIGRIAGVSQMKMVEDVIRKGQYAQTESVIHVQFAPKDIENVEAYRAIVQVVDNNTTQSDTKIRGILNTLLDSAFGGSDACATELGEFRFALPESFDLEPEAGSVLEDLGLKSISLHDVNVAELDPFYLGLTTGIDLNFTE
ncbi:MAG: hypothetical protein H7A32_02135 [Deltaproteobacteria bacterium]|nr:hypothetical protein [Deltaproteobacteria bacterium]